MNATLLDTNGSNPSTITLTFSPIVTALYIILYLPVFIGTVFGNFLVIVAFIQNKRLRKVSNYFLVSLAVTDFLTGLFALPLNLTPRLIIAPATCYETPRFNFFLPAFVFSGSSIYHLSAIAIDRLIAVYCPFKYPRIVTPCRVRVVLFVIWAYNIFFGFIPFFIPGGGTDQWVCDDNNGSDQDISTLLLCIAIFIPVYFVGMLLLYAILLRKAGRHIRKHSHLSVGTKHTNQHSEAKSRARGLVTMAIVVGAFGVCWLPTSFQFLFEIYFVYDATLLIIVQTLCEYQGFVSSMVNPIIYAVRNKEFKAGMKSAAKCTTMRNSRWQSRMPHKHKISGTSVELTGAKTDGSGTTSNPNSV